MKRRIIPDVINGRQRLITLARSASVCKAAALMHDGKVGAVMIVEEGVLLGIFTERDLTRCIAMHLELDATPLGLVMTRRPKTIHPSDTPMQALQHMHEGKFRHLPVVDGSEPVGMVSARDLLASVRHELEAEVRTSARLAQSDSYEIAHAI